MMMNTLEKTPTLIWGPLSCDQNSTTELAHTNSTNIILRKLEPPPQILPPKTGSLKFYHRKINPTQNVLPLYKMIKPTTQTNSRIGMCYQN
jgi:hypothetical protein